jgi:hypothetical protein
MRRAVLPFPLLLLLAAAPARAEVQEVQEDGGPLFLTARATAPIVADGRLDEADWAAAPPLAGFVQIEPERGRPASRDTEVKVLFDGRLLVFGFRCHDAAGSGGVRVTDLRRDFDDEQNDFVGVVLDPFGDGRTAQAFAVNPYGAQRDLRASDGTQRDLDWNTVWHAGARIAEDGWTAEIALPWTSLRYPAGAGSWRANFVRRIRRQNELTAWVEFPRNVSPYHMTFAGTLAGLEPPPPGRNLRLTPYALARADRNELSGAAERGESYDLGGEVKWLPGPATVVDATVNTDFAQAEVDRQVVNLSRFSVFFPEKRQFFLESSSLFESDFDNVKPFFSRRIGLDDSGRPIGIDAGLRLVHQDAGHAWGGLLLRTREEGGAPASTFGMARYSKNLGARHRLGGLLVHRRDEGGALGERIDNTVAVVDGLYRPHERYSLQGLLSASTTPGGGDGFAGSLWTYYENEWIYAGLVEQVISEDYDPRAGFVLARNLIVTSPAVTLDWRPAWRPRRVRSLKPNVVSYLYHDHDDREFREGWVRLEPLWIVFDDGSEVWSWWEPNWQRLAAAFSPLPGLEVAPGDYDYSRWGIAARTDRSRRTFVEARYLDGGFFDGELQTTILAARLSPSPRLALRVDYERNAIRDLGPARAGRVSELVISELRLALDPRLQLTLFHQHNTAAERESWNARLVWEWRPLSFAYLVYTEASPTDPGAGFLGSPEFRDRQLILKLAWSRPF